MTRKTQIMLRRLIPYAAVLIIGALIVAGVIYFSGKSRIVPSETDADAQAVSDQDGSDEDQGIIDLDQDPVMEVESTESMIAAVDQVNVDKLIDRYYEAKSKDDAEELNNIVDTDTPYNEADLVDETQFVSRYDNFRTYVMPGITDNYFVVYVKYDIFFNGINTGAPALNRYIVVKDEDGYYYIYDKEVSGEFQSYLEQTEQSEIVAGLKKQVETELKEACDSNEDLKYLISMLSGEKEPDSTDTDIQDYDGGSTNASETVPEETDGTDASSSDPEGSGADSTDEPSASEDTDSYETQEFTEDGNS